MSEHRETYIPENLRAISHDEQQIRDTVDNALMIGKAYFEIAGNAGCDVRGKDILEIGPGPTAGPAMILACLGAHPAVAEPYLPEWDEDFHPRVYRGIAGRVKDILPHADPHPLYALADAGGHDADLVNVFEYGAEDLPEDLDKNFDCVFSNAVLEHVVSLKRSAQRLFAITRPGGEHFHQIDFRDHRDQAKPLELMLLQPKEIHKLKEERCFEVGAVERKPEYDEAFESAGFEIINSWSTDNIDEDYLKEFLPRLRSSGSPYADYPEKDMKILGCGYYLRRKS